MENINNIALGTYIMLSQLALRTLYLNSIQQSIIIFYMGPKNTGARWIILKISVMREYLRLNKIGAESCFMSNY